MDIMVKDIFEYIDQWAPFDQAEEWDNVGLLVGNLNRPVNKTLLTLDVTTHSFAEAKNNNCNLIVSHHPLIFSPLKSILNDRPGEKLIYELIRNDINLITAHTNLDAAPGGVADTMTNTVLNTLGDKLASCRELSRYGRCLMLSQELTLKNILSKTADFAGTVCRINMPVDTICRKIAVYPGSFPAEEIDTLVQEEVDLVVCGEIKHHVNILLADFSIAVLDIGHGKSEQLVLQPFADRLGQHFANCQFAVHRSIDYNRTAY